MCRKFFGSFLVLAGIALLLLNIYSFFYVIPRNVNANKTPSAQDVIAALDKLHVPTKGDYEQYYQEVTDLFYQGIKHAWYEEDKTLGPSFFYNWSLWIYSKIDQYIPLNFHYMKVTRDNLERFQYLNYRDAIERGVGLCSQHAIAVANYLNKRGFNARVVGLNGHVVNEVVSPNGTVLVIDSDYNVTMNFSIQYARAHPAIVKKYYINAGVRKKEAGRVAQIYKASSYKPYTHRIQDINVVFCCVFNWFSALILIFVGCKICLNFKLRSIV